MSLLMNFGANSSSSSSSSNKRAARSSADIGSILPDTALWHILASPGLRAVDIILGSNTKHIQDVYYDDVTAT
jgi:hypothetical protein